jgi:ABC-2 type transport system ATP-binding protein
MPDFAVETFNINKSFGELCAVNGINIQVGNGEFFGFLGPNGAGKSTLIRMLTTVLRPTSGTATVAGFDIVKDPGEVRRSIGVVTQSMASDMDLTARENMDIFGKFYEVPRKERRARTEELLERVGLTKKADDLVATYSGGMRRRLDIARVLVHMPKILFLDEPTSGLDPQSRRVVWDMLIGFMKDYQLTVFLTTHYMDEAETLCNRVAIIDHGNIIVKGTPDELKAGLPGNDIVVLDIGGGADRIREAAEKEPYVHKANVEGGELRLYVDDGGRDAPLLMQLAAGLGVKVGSVAIQKQSLEDVFIHHTGRSIREEESRKVSMFLGAGIPQKLGR